MAREKKPAAAATAAKVPESIRTGNSVASLKQSVLDNLFYAIGRPMSVATRHDLYTALSLTVRDRLMEKDLESIHAFSTREFKTVCYLSAEFLMGPQLGANLFNLGIYEAAEKALQELGLRLDDLLEVEEEPGLGNGGLGRLAACYLEAMASVEVPAMGFGIRYEFGIFDQAIRDGWQVEMTDKWLRLGNPWEIHRPEIGHEVMLGGRTEAGTDAQGRYRVRWIPERVVKGTAYDTPIAGYKVNTCNLLRLWKAEALESFDFAAFNQGDYTRAVEEKVGSENISKVLYPNDDQARGKRLRLEQQYFFVACTLQDLLRVHLAMGRKIETFCERFVIQLNDTHPSVGIAELMRLLVDVHGLDWDAAWAITSRTFGYTNHTLLPEALEKWPVDVFGQVLPRHLEIVYEINHRFLQEVRAAFPGDEGRAVRVSIIEEGPRPAVRMAHLATVGAFAVNGVAALHTELLKRDLLPDFVAMWPGKFHNVTNGVTPRRFVGLSNPGLTKLISSRIGDGWLKNLDGLRALEPLAGDAGFEAAWRAVKLENKRRLAELIRERTGVAVDPESLFDVQVKRIHEYKRQHLNALHVLARYFRLKRDPSADLPARTVIFGGKSAPGYFMAKRVIKLIHSLGEVINSDPDVRGRLKVVFFPDFNVKNAQHIYPAADLSEQISTAGKEASGTGNMKFALNGALTIGTLDGANVEIREAVGAENFFLFGLTVPEVAKLWRDGYRPYDVYERSETLRETLDALVSGTFSRGDRELFRPLVDSLLDRDTFLLLADFEAYVACQARVDELWRQPAAWTRKAILNVARMGRFSADRSILEYCEKVWKTRPMPI
ncbi:MAG: glycogen/starch/alpha-glucan phosphorylase [Planctomycetes bacterium]|nr:glycogen/starch/alpha-glucan phosphorylase [Planctomycetota bacterium]